MGLALTGLVRVEAPHYTAGLTCVEGVCTEAAPILRWALSKHWTYLEHYFTRKGFNVTTFPETRHLLKDKHMTTTPFNPFAQPATAQPAFTPPTAPAAPQPAPFAAPVGPPRGGLDDPANDGPGGPLMPHIDGNYTFRVVGYTTFVGHKSGPAVHVTCQVLESSNPQLQPGSTARFIYKYDFVNDRPAQGNVGLVHMRLLRNFWQSASKNPQASVLELHKRALGTDWSQVEVLVKAQCTVVPYSRLVNGQVTVEPRRNESWIAA